MLNEFHFDDFTIHFDDFTIHFDDFTKVCDVIINRNIQMPILSS